EERARAHSGHHGNRRKHSRAYGRSGHRERDPMWARWLIAPIVAERGPSLGASKAARVTERTAALELRGVGGQRPAPPPAISGASTSWARAPSALARNPA